MVDLEKILKAQIDGHNCRNVQMAVAAAISEALEQTVVVSSVQVRGAIEALIEQGVIENPNGYSARQYAQYCSVPRTNGHIHGSKKFPKIFMYTQLRGALSEIVCKINSEFNGIVNYRNGQRNTQRIGNLTNIVLYYRDEDAMRRYLQELLASRTFYEFNVTPLLGQVKETT